MQKMFKRETGILFRIIRKPVFAFQLPCLLLFVTCFTRNPLTTGPETYHYPGMVRIRSSNDSVFLGSAAATAQIDEKPETPVSFTYDFSIDTAEVTVGSYRELTGKIPQEYDSVSSVDDTWPVTWVSWYDAVLYCNERSKKENLDTVYSYIAIDTTMQGDIYRLRGLNIRFNRSGYRLPTEAEWLYAARGHSRREYLWGDEPDEDSAAKYSWYVGNSTGLPNGTAQKSPNSNGLYDMAGNATEFINESKIPLSGKTVADLVGGVDIGSTTKILKGGSYHHDLFYFRLCSRSDQYDVDAASRNRYAGFRCAAGAIVHPSYFTKDNQIVSLEPVALTTTSLLAVTGTNRAKLVFVNVSNTEHRTLCYVDYSEGQPQVNQFTDSLQVYTPTVSPDGSRVAWCTGDEGSVGDARVYVRGLDSLGTVPVALPDTPAFVPRWWVDPASKDTFVLYVSSARLNDQAAWRQSTTRMMLFENGAFSGSPVVIEENGAYHGGRSADGTFLATGYPRLKMKNLVTGAEKTLFFSPLNGKKENDTSQVCNVSICPDTAYPDRVFFLDFGSGRETSTLTGTVYHSHEYLFCCDFTGKVQSWYRIPPPYYLWNYSEWSTHRNFVVASATTTDGANRAILCLNTKNSRVTQLCEGTNLCQPWLWLDASTVDTLPAAVDLDSIGQYDSPHLNVPQAIMAYKMRYFWRYADSLDFIFTGSSITNNGIDPAVFTGLKGYNMGVDGGDLATPFMFIRNYVLSHCSRLKIIGLSFDASLFLIPEGKSILHPAFTSSKGYQYDKRNLFWTMEKPLRFTEIMNAVEVPPTTATTNISPEGLQQYPCNGWGPPEPPVIAGNVEKKVTAAFYENVATLLELVRLCKTQDISIILVAFPMHPGYAQSYAYSTNGPTQEVASVIFSKIDSIAGATDGLHFYDAHNFGQHDYTEFEFCNYLHLCPDGAGKLSARLDSIFHEILAE